MHAVKWKAILILIICISSFSSFAKQPPFNFIDKFFNIDTLKFLQKSSIPNAKRIKTLNYSIAGMYGLSMTWLYSQWYDNYPRSAFHFFNDNSEWQQMDKFGHFWTAYNISKPLMHCYRWGGYDEKKSTLYGAGISFLFLTTIEVFDGFSD